MRIKKKPGGFTLIEVTVVVAIVGIASAMTLVSIAGGRISRDVDHAVRETVVLLRGAQSFALSGQSTSANENNCSFNIRMAAGGGYEMMNTYRDGSGNCVLTGVMASATLKNGVVFSGMTLPATIAFNLPRGEVTYWNGSAMAPLTSAFRIGLSKGGTTKYVCISPVGQIRENGSDSTCP